MNTQVNSYSTKIPKWVIYLGLAIIGVVIVYLCSLIQQVPDPKKGEYYYTYFFRDNFSLLPKLLFITIGFFAGYSYGLNPWLSGICLISFFPLTSIIEATVYRGSHNLIPFEFAFHLWLSLPSIVAVFIGKYISRRVHQRRLKIG